MAEEMLTLPKFEEASEIVKKVTQETKLVYSKYFSEQTGNKVYLKPENMQLTGAYKLRGAYYKISTLSEEERAKGLITASAGNHAQGVAYAAKCYGAKAVIVMPTTTPLIKVERTQSYGAEVVLYGDVYDEACAKAYELAAEHGYTFIHPFDDLTVATGQGTIAMEVIQELPLVDYILVPIGGDRIVPVLPQNLCNRQKIFCAVRKYLRNDCHSRIVFRADVIFLPVSKLFIRHKRRKIAFDSTVIFCVCIPVDISGNAFHGCHIILYLLQLSSPSARNLSLILIQHFPPVK